MARKSARRHPDVSSADLVRIGELLETGIVHRQDPTHLHVQSREDLPWVLAVEALADGEYLKAATLFKASADRWIRDRRKFGDVLRK